MRKHVLITLFLMAAVSTFAQSGNPDENRQLAEKWCSDHPEAVLCDHGRPVEFKLPTQPQMGNPAAGSHPKATPIFQPGPAPRPAPVRAPAVVSSAAPKLIDLGKPDWRFAHAKPDLLLAINPGAITRSPLFTKTYQEMLAKMSQEDRPKIALVMGIIGNIERVQISLHSVAGVKDPDYVVLITGQLDGMVRQILTQSQQGLASRQLSPNSLLLGKAATIDQAVRRMSGAAGPAIADELSSSDIWFSGEPGLLAAAAKSPLAPGIDSLRRFSVGLNFQDALELYGNLSMLNDAGAEKMMALFELGKAQAAQTPEASALVQAAKIDRLGSQIRFRMTVPSAMLQASLPQAQAMGGGVAGADLSGLFGMFGGKGQGAGVAAPKESAPPQNPGKIMIYGLDDGPREVGEPKKESPAKN